MDVLLGAHDWRELERYRVAEAAANGTPIRTVDYECNHAAGRFDTDESKSHPAAVSEKQRLAIQNFHTTHKLKRRPDFLGD